MLYSTGAVLGVVDELLVDLHSGHIAYLIALCRNGDRRIIPWAQVEYCGGDFRLKTRPLSC